MLTGKILFTKTNIGTVAPKCIGGEKNCRSELTNKNTMEHKGGICE